MHFEVPAGTALVFSDSDGGVLSEPRTQPVTRIVQTAPAAR